jgi:hypothetical protein
MTAAVEFVIRRDGVRYQWVPKEDVTVYELARCMPMFTCDPSELNDVYDCLPYECKRHWRVLRNDQ